MGLNPARIIIASDPPHAVIRIVGRAAVERARDFDGAVRQLVAQGVSNIDLDLRECPLLDSTFSGTVALLAEEVTGDKPMVRFTLIDAKSRIVDGLANLEVLSRLQVAPPGSVATAAGDEVELPLSQSSHREMGEFCLRAHRALMALSTANATRFQELEAMLSLEMGKGPDR